MSSKTKESDVQLELHFLDCRPDCIDRSLNDQSVLDHLYRAVTQNILQLENSDQRNQSHRITDIDQLVVLLDHVTFTPRSMTKHIPIELTGTDNRQVEIPVIKAETKHSPMEVQVKTTGVIPPAPPLPPSLDLAINLQKQAMKIEVLSPDKDSLWSLVRFSFIDIQSKF